MSKSVEIQLMEILQEFEEELGDNAEEAFKEVGEDTSSDLKVTSPKGHDRKHYANGWTYKMTGKGLNTVLVVYNKLKPSLTHLLENGHEVFPHGRANAHPHIEPAQKKATEELMRKLREL